MSLCVIRLMTKKTLSGPPPYEIFWIHPRKLIHVFQFIYILTHINQSSDNNKPFMRYCTHWRSSHYAVYACA